MTTPTIAPYDITNLNGVSGSQLNLLMWTNPSTYTAGMFQYIFEYAHVRWSPTTFPSNLSEGTHIGNVSGSGPSYIVHKNIENGTQYYYSLWAGFIIQEIGEPPTNLITYLGPYTIGPLTPASGAQFCSELKISFTKLESNTRLYDVPEKLYTVDMVVWLPTGQEQRKTAIVKALKDLKPAHTVIRVFWEPYYVACTTTAQFMSGSFDSTVYEVTNGTLINEVPTIDSSFGGDTSLL